MGAGKTTLAQGVLRGLGVSGRLASPSFTLVRTYDGRLTAAHVDLYRLEDVPPEDGVWLAETVEGAQVILVEWPERVPGLLPQDHLHLDLAREGEGRVVRARAGGPAARDWWERAASRATFDIPLESGDAR